MTYVTSQLASTMLSFPSAMVPSNVVNRSCILSLGPKKEENKEGNKYVQNGQVA